MAGGDLLRGVPVLAGLSAEQRDRLAAEGRERQVPAGDWLLREGEPADTMYVIRSGRLDVVAEGPPEALIRTLRRGDVVGELALLHAGRRTASVRARRHCELLELSREQFETLVAQEPSFAVALTRSLGAQLAVSQAPPAAAPAPPRTIAVVALDPGAPGARAVAQLEANLAATSNVVRLGASAESDPPAMLGVLERAERDAGLVLLVTGAPEAPWTQLCLREADLIVALTTGTPEPGWTRHVAALGGCELLVFGSQAPADLLAALAPRETQVLSDDARLTHALGALARRLTGRAVGVVLSGGGARAFAHLGVLEELLSAGLVIDRLGGVSLGAAVAASVATGADTGTVYTTFRESFVTTSPTRDYVIPAYSLLRGARVREILARHFGHLTIEALPVRFTCVSCDLIAREAVVHRTGPLDQAVYASLAIPAVFPAVATADGRLLVDGGVLDNLPVAAMARTGEGPVIASDVTGHAGTFARRRRPGLEGLARSVRRGLTGSEAALPRLGETILRTVTVGSTDTVAAGRRHADLVITPRVDHIGLMDWRRLDEARELGREAARTALAGAQALPWS
ncbi:MAG: hypothetical protein QOG68_476 [Solirubrobacteraceae bacterium]|nr:hypothetical protein [Solirubrobacteraceae bacterium]